MWLAVPPFAVVDMTLRFQRWERDPFQEAIAPALLIETPRVVHARAEDVVAPAVRQACAAHTGRHDPNLHIRLFPDQERISRIFPARRCVVGDCEFRHVPARVTASDVPLERINKAGSQGAPAIEIWTEDVMPALGLHEDACRYVCRLARVLPNGCAACSGQQDFNPRQPIDPARYRSDGSQV
jgi:hypothetical protein